MVGLALIAIAVLAWMASRAAGLNSPAIAATLASAVAIAGPTWWGRSTSHLGQATLLTGFCCLIGAYALHRGRVAEPWPPTDDGPTPWVLRIPIALMTVGVVWAAVGSHFWDEYSCHYPTAAVIARGVFPPELPMFPGEPFRYHFGYDVLAAHVRSLTGVPIDVALDAATIGSFTLLLAMAREVGRTFGGRWGGGFVMLLAPLGGGTLAFLLFGDMGSLEVHWSALPRKWMSSTPPPVISNFFQHPQGLGMSFALAVISLFARPPSQPKPPRRTRLIVGMSLLGVLALVNIVFFAVLGLALGVLVTIRAISTGRYRRAAEELVALLIALGIGISLGGFFAAGPAVDQMLVWGRSFFAGGFWSVVAQHLVLFGLPWIFLPWNVLATARRPSDLSIAAAAAAVIGFAIPNLVVYARSWDIVKFLGVGMFFANLLFALQLARWTNAGRRGAAAALVATLLATNTAWIWLVRVSVLDGRLGVPKIHFPPSSRTAHALGLELEGMIGPRERVLTNDVDLARAAGFLAPGFDWRQVGQGFMLDRDRAERWHRLKVTAMRTLDPAAVRELDVRWAVFGPHDLHRLAQVGRERLGDPARYEPIAEIGEGAARRWVYRIRPPAYGASTRR